MKAVIFDIDNTVYSYDVCNNKGEQAMYGYLLSKNYLTKEEFISLLSTAKAYVKRNNSGTAACHNRMLYSQHICESFGIYDPTAVIELYNAYWDNYFSVMKLFDGAEKLMYELADSGIRIAFCTDLTADIQLRKLVKLGLGKLPHMLVTSEEVGAEKPDRKMFETVLEKLDVPADEAVMIGDSVEKDILGARKVGIHGILFGSESNEYDHACDFGELSRILERIRYEKN